MTDETYNGYANWETWNAFNWLSSDEGSYAQAQVAAAYDGPRADDAWVDFVSEYAYGSLRLDHVYPPSGLGTDLLEATLRRIDYVELRDALR